MDSAFWMNLLGQRMKEPPGENQRSEMLYDVLLPWLAGDRLVSTILAEERDNADWRVRKKMLMTKFRIERNYWISLFTLTLWIVLNRYRHAVKEISDLRKKLKSK